MKEADKQIITDDLGVAPVCINASCFLPQNRDRCYWTNIPLSELPQPSTLKLENVLEENAPEKYYYNKPFALDDDLSKNVIGTIQLKTYEANRRVFNPKGIVGCLTCVSGGYQEKKVYDMKKERVRKLMPIEYERLQGLPDNYTFGLCDSKRYTVCGNAWCVPVIEFLLKGV